MSSIEDSSEPKSLTDLVAEVLGRHGVQFVREQAEELAKRLGSLGVRSAVEVLDCVLDPECLRYGPESRVPVEKAFEEVFGEGSLVRAQIAEELRRHRLDELVSVGAVYESYRELELLLYELRKEGLIKSRAYRQTLIKAAIIDSILRLAKPDELAYAIDFFEDILGWGRALKLLRDVRGLQYYLYNLG